jgi:small subunit ribosomal protein S21
MEVTVNDNNVDHALRILKKKMQREGVYKDMKLRRHFEKPSVKKARKRVESLRRSRKMSRKRSDRPIN